MTQTQLHAAVAQATGESVATINRRGFHEVSVDEKDHIHPSDPVRVLDCPFCGSPLILATDRFQQLPAFAECQRCETIIDYGEW